MDILTEALDKWRKSNPYDSQLFFNDNKRRHLMSGYVRFIPTIDKVIFNPPATVVIWTDGKKTVVKANEKDEFSKEFGLAMAVSKRYFGGRGNFLKIVDKGKLYE